MKRTLTFSSGPQVANVRRRFWTVRVKLAALFFAVFALILSAVCGAILLTRQRELRAQFDERLTDRAAVIVEEIGARLASAGSQAYAQDTGQALNPFRFPGHFFQIRRADGTLLERSTSLGEHVLPLTPLGEASRETSRPVVESLADDLPEELLGPQGEVRLLTLYQREPNGSAFCLQIAAGTGSLRESLRRLWRVLLITIPLGLLIASIASWFLAGRWLAPLARMAEVAERLSAHDLSKRFDQPRSKDDVADLVRTMNRMLDRLSAAFASQERFIADVAHELNTPLAALLGQAQVLLQKDRGPEEYARFVADIQDEVRTLSQTVESLLTLARAEAGLPMGGVSEVPINDTVMDAVTRCSNLAVRREVRLVPRLVAPQDDRPGPLVAGDSALLALMFANLIRNAVRFSPPNGPVDIGVQLDDQTVIVSVRDRGPGIPPEYVERVFDRFFRVPDPNASFQGVGLGLTIARGIARLHGGEVQASNRPGGGSEFLVRLPASRSRSFTTD